MSGVNQAWTVNDQTKVEATVGGGMVDRLRQRVHCRFCGGKQCKHEDWTRAVNRKNSHVAIQGLHSNWVENWAIASQRPATILFQQHNLIEQFKRCNLKAVFNLQETGEHPFCGPQGHLFPQSGFSYVPEVDLMPHGISHYNFPWPDMGTPNFDIVLRTVQVMCDHVSKGERFLVHCHAGLGRTGLMIACWMMYQFGYDAKETVARVRRQRPGSIQTSSQLKFTYDFHSFLVGQRQVFGKVEGLEGHLARQRSYLHGQEARALRCVPKLAHSVLTRMLDLVDLEFSELGTTTKGDEMCSILVQSVERRREGRRMRTSMSGRVAELRQSCDDAQWGELKKAKPPLLVEILLEFLYSLASPVVQMGTVSEVILEFSHRGYPDMQPHVLRNGAAPQPHPPVARQRDSPTNVLEDARRGAQGIASPVYSPRSSGSRSSRKLPPLGTRDGAGSPLPALSFNGKPMVNVYSSDEDGLSPQGPSKLVSPSPSRKQEALLHRVAHRLWASQKSSSELASVLLKEHLPLSNYHTTGVFLSSVRLMSWDLTQARQVEVITAALEVLTRQTPTSEEVQFFSTAAKEWGDQYFTRGTLAEVAPQEAGVPLASMYSSWLARLYSHKSELGKCPYDCGFSTPPPEVLPAEEVSVSVGTPLATPLGSESGNGFVAPPPTEAASMVSRGSRVQSEPEKSATSPTRTNSHRGIRRAGSRRDIQLQVLSVGDNEISEILNEAKHRQSLGEPTTTLEPSPEAEGSESRRPPE